jgi:hypothetical protein
MEVRLTFARLHGVPRVWGRPEGLDLASDDRDPVRRNADVYVQRPEEHAALVDTFRNGTVRYLREEKHDEVVEVPCLGLVPAARPLPSHVLGIEAFDDPQKLAFDNRPFGTPVADDACQERVEFGEFMTWHRGVSESRSLGLPP